MSFLSQISIDSNQIRKRRHPRFTVYSGFIITVNAICNLDYEFDEENDFSKYQFSSCTIIILN